VHRRPAHWALDVEQGFALLQEHGPQRILGAFAQGVRQRAIGAEYVRAHLTGTAAQEIAG
jgi:aminoglycoside/choline kinase family phosphotransferase